MQPSLYKISKNLEPLKETPFKKERELQNIFEANLPQIMGLMLVKSEFVIKNKRVDTLAFDQESKAFVIIEYKRDRNSSVVDQGFTYLSLMLQNKADFILEYNEQNQIKHYCVMMLIGRKAGLCLYLPILQIIRSRRLILKI